MLSFLAAPLLMLLFVWASALCSQQPASIPLPARSSGQSTLTINARMVAVAAVAYDPDGRLVGGLNKDDFALAEDGKPQTIRYFNRDSDLPLTIGLMVDTSGSQAPYGEEERRASAIFLQEMMTRPGDRAFLERFDSLAVLLQPMTSDVVALQNSLRLLTAPIPPPKFSRGTLLFDAICATAQKVVGKEAGRRAIIILTDGDDDGSTSTLADAIHAAQLADVAVYSVLYTRESVGQSNGGYSSGMAAMQQISDATGGHLFIVTQGMTIERIYTEIEDDMRDQYRIGYTPPPSAPNRYHRIELKTRDNHLTVEARSGYYTPR